jgi:hypothetical protein
MNFSAETARRKWPIAAPGRGQAAMVTVTVALLAWLTLGATPAAARRSHHPDLFGDLFSDRPVRLRGAVRVHEAKVPLPRPRPAEAPNVEPEKPATAKAAPAEPDKSSGPAATAIPIPTPRPSPSPSSSPTPQPSACRLALTEEIAIAPSVPDIHGPGGCGGEDLVRLEAIVLPNKHRVLLNPAATLRCGMAAAVADWVRAEVAPLEEGLGSEVSTLDNFDSYECRGRNGIAGAPLSEHGRANAIDVGGWKLANGQSIGLTDRNVPRGLRETVLHSVCARFMTVLGPGSDGYHEDHIHLDLMERHNNYKICQWNVWDPLPPIAPLMPVERPAEAPPRRVAGQKDEGQDDKGQGDKSDDAAPKGSAEPAAREDTKPDGVEQTNSQSSNSRANKSATKKRRQNRRF